LPYNQINQLINLFARSSSQEEVVMPKKGFPFVTKSLSALIARTQFGQIMERASQNRERFLVTKNGEAKVVILGVEDFLQAIVKTPKSLAMLQEQARKSGADTLTLEEIEAEIAAVRRTNPRTKT
jgi:prevent-host-death family protein